MEKVISEWDDKGVDKTLLVLPTGTGKTIVFSKIIENRVSLGKRVLVLAHRGELLEQAADKLYKSTGLKCSVEKAEESCIGSFFRVVVGSVQSLQREKRLSQFSKDYFDNIIIDEAHHCLSDGYTSVLNHFSEAKVLGVTATPDRGDRKNLGTVFESLAYEYTLPRAIKDGYLSPIKAMTVPLKLDISAVATQSGDFKTSELGNALEPYLHSIAEEMEKICKDRKTVVFLPLVSTSKKFCKILCDKGFNAAEVNGESSDRSQVLEDFADGKYNVLCNSMLLTEGWDCPDIDCVIVLRPTKVRSLYCLDSETEVLTKNGWKNDVKIGEEVAAFNPDTGEIIFTPTIAKVRRLLDDDEFFCSLHGPSVDIRVTNKHRMLYDNKRRKGWKFKTAEQITDMKDGCYLPVSGHGKFKGVPLSDDEIRFIGWVMTDGCINKTNGQITITQASHQPWIEEIQKCIDGCGFKHNRFVAKCDTEYHRNSDCVCWTISKGKPRGRDKHLRGWGALEPYLSKDISPLLNDMSERQFDVLLEAINLGDGWKPKTIDYVMRSYHIRKGNKAFIEGLQKMALQRGYRASFTSTLDTKYNRIWCVHLKKQDFVRVGGQYDERPKWVKEAHTNEECWCVENELGTLVTRRNGKVSIVGNCQMVGRGTRLSPGKDHLLLLDFLWHTERHELCHPAHLIATDEEVAKIMTKNLEDLSDAACPTDIQEALEQAESDAIAQREEALAKVLEEMKKRKRSLVDPLQYEMSIQDSDLASYVPSFGWEMAPPSKEQLQRLEKFGIFPDEVGNAGKASLIIDKLIKRRDAGLTTPKQIRFLEGKGFKHVGTWQFDEANKMIARISANGWRIPTGVSPQSYMPN